MNLFHLVIIQLIICVLESLNYQKHYEVARGKNALWDFKGHKNITASLSGTRFIHYYVTLDKPRKPFFSIILLSISMSFCILAAVLTTSFCFLKNLVNSFIVFFMPPPRSLELEILDKFRLIILQNYSSLPLFFVPHRASSN